MSDPTHPIFRFESQALDPQAFEVLRFEGTEEISRLYHFEIDLVSHNSAINLDNVIGSPACLVITREPGERRINGIVASVVQGEECEPGRYAYRATLVPRLWMLSQNRRSRIYQSKSIPEIVAEQLEGLANLRPDTAASADASETVVFRLKQNYPAREYRVQYAETDLDFMSRLLEHEGISYFFEQGEQCERLVITDHNGGFSSCSDDSDVPFSPSPYHEYAESVRSFVCEQRSAQRKLVLNDYNYRLPQVPLQAESDIDAQGVGLIAEHETHFSTPEEGARLSTVRSEEILCRQRTYTGNGDHSDFHAGLRYQLTAHFREDFNQDYLISRVRHIGGPTGHDLEGVTYGNEFESVPASLTYRPERVTAKPKLHGIMSAHVDGCGPGDRAEIDDQGRYKLVMPFDLSGAREGNGSCFIRMAQPYGGKDHGMHFPLSRGTEVVWTCIDGDPDRPIITGTVPNPIHRSVVTSENSERNVLRTAGGVTMEFSDGGQPLMEETTGARDTIEPSNVFTGIPPEERGSSAQLSRQRQFQPPATQATETLEANKWFKLYVPDHNPIGADGKSSTYLRLGSCDPTDDIEKNWLDGGSNNGSLKLNTGSNKQEASVGVFDYTEWNRTTITMNNHEQYIHGKSRITIGGGGLGVWDAGYAYKNYFRQVGTIAGQGMYRHTTMDHASSDSYQFGDTESFFGGFNFSGFAGLNTGVTVGGSLNIGLSADVNFGYAFTVDASLGPTVDVCAESQKTSDAQDHDILCANSVQIRVKGDVEAAADKTAWQTFKAVAGTAGALSVPVVAAVAGGAAMPIWSAAGSNTEDSKSTWASAIGLPAATAVWAGALIYGGIKNRSVDTSAKLSPSSFDLQKDSITLAVGLKAGGISVPLTSSRIEIKPDGITSKSAGPTGSSVKVGDKGIKMSFGGPAGSSIEIDAKGIKLKCGTTVVRLTPDRFNATGPQCTISAKAKTLIKGNAGVALKGIGSMAI